MGAEINGLKTRCLNLDRSDLVVRGGALVGFVFIACSWLYVRPSMGGPLWQRAAASVLVILLVVCLAAMLWTDIWPLRLVLVIGLITFSEFIAGVTYRQESDSLLLAHSLAMGASSVVALSLRRTWKSAAFTALLGALVLGHTHASSMVHGLGPTTLLIVTGFWLILLAIRHTAPKALDALWSDQEVKAVSNAAQAVARNTISANQADARLLHDTVLRSLAVVAHGGAGADPGQLREVLTVRNVDGGALGSRTSSLFPAAVDADVSEPTHRALAVVERSSAQDLASLLTERAVRHSRQGFSISVFGEAGTLPEATQAAMVDAAEECMVNAARHAGTDRVDVLVSRTGSLVSVLISDAGCGFHPEAIPGERFGVRQSVVNRMDEVGGRARVLSAPGRGTTVVLETEVLEIEAP
ncbi:sensor histidine kinase [Paenarthrobacter sp. NPDC091711]|uniref:sensor histidine kinase n=1 Tax=Paenarthrobacter sp. NPDC091711 TaxID=3364385 RepID=UPI00380D8EC8